MEPNLTLRKSIIALGAGTALLLSGCDASSDTPSGGGSFKDDLPDTSAARLIYEVTEADFAVLESFPLQLQISARGRTRTGGWSDPVLVLDEDASDLNTLVYQFRATAPRGMATQAFSPIEATARFMPYDPEHVTQVQIVAETNEMTFPLSGE